MKRKPWWILLLFVAVNLALVAVVAAITRPLLAPLPIVPTLPLAPISSFEEQPTFTATPENILQPTTRPTAEPLTITQPMPTDITTHCVLTATGGLASEIYSIMQAMPGAGSDGFVVPSTDQRSAWQALVQAAAQGDAPAACAILQANGFPYHLVHYTDVRNNNEHYWMLKEDIPTSLGWGTYIFRTETPLADYILEIPHPVADWRTDVQGVELFRQTGARALLIAGTHRCANASYSACAGETMACGPLEPYRQSDPAHTVESMFQAAHQALVPCGGTTVAVQLHANDLAACPDLFISNGTLRPGPLARSLEHNAAAACPDFGIDLADGEPGECGYVSGVNVQAMYTNTCSASPDCTTIPSLPSNPEQFISLEQSAALREDYACLVQALQATFPIRK